MPSTLPLSSTDDLDLPSLYRIITSAPRTAAEEADPAWRENPTVFDCWK